MEVILTRIVNRSEDGLLTTSAEFSPSLPATNHCSPCHAATPWGHRTGAFNFEQTNSYQVPSLKPKLGGHLASHFGIQQETYDRRLDIACTPRSVNHNRRINHPEH